MPMQVDVFVEEPSMAAALEALLPRLLAEGASFRIFDLGSKLRLLRELPQRLAAYRRWCPPETYVLVLVDRDQDDCRALKARLEAIAAAAELPTRSTCPAAPLVINRVVIEELEAWYFGDIPALTTAYPGVPATLAAQAPYRDPDAIRGGTWEALERVLMAAGHFPNGLAKIAAARTIAPHMRPERNTSASFQALRTALASLTP